MEKKRIQNHAYNHGQNNLIQELSMAKRKITQNDQETFGKRMARFRKAAGFTQRELAKDTGISQRMIAYYESQSDYPPGALLPIIAKILNVSSDVLLGIKKETKISFKDARLLSRFKKVEKLSSKDRRQIIKLLDTFIENEKLKQAV